jgi:hypothetical protein
VEKERNIWILRFFHYLCIHNMRVYQVVGQGSYPRIAGSLPGPHLNFKEEVHMT